ncbi:RtcB family protein [Butyricicoccus sp.]|uniref:RtcB family protein n=1 Tax=Butyricicoccus sp. TaxID=2049021 RepID=UPI003D7DD05B
MIAIRGTYNTAKCFCKTLEPQARQQIQQVCDQRAFADSKIRIMPDVHAGVGCTIGTTMTLTDKVVPGMVGVDIGCGMETVQLKETQIDFDELDRVIRTYIPSGHAIHAHPHPLAKDIDLRELRCAGHVDIKRAQCSIGTLGGGNHFIEIDRGEDGHLYLVVHSGSRHLGVETASFYQKAGWKALQQGYRPLVQEAMQQLKAQGREQEIARMTAKIKREYAPDVPKELAYVSGKLFAEYIHDMKLVQRFAVRNRQAMVQSILQNMRLTCLDAFSTIHNYIDTDAMILRKGSVSAKLGETLLIPINMRDGSLICVGKGNEDWNQSAPHGAGRLMSRTDAKNTLTLEQFQQSMRGIYTTCVQQGTLDESPMAYKTMNEIVEQIAPTADIVQRIRPVYNFKAAE